LTKFWVSSARDFSLLSAKHWSRRVSPKLLLTNVQGSNYKSEYAAPEIFISRTYLCEVQRGQKTKWVRQKMSMTTSRVLQGENTWWTPFPTHCWPLLNAHELGNEVVDEERCLTVKSTLPASPNIQSHTISTIKQSSY
jgi:hypothetical protein